MFLTSPALSGTKHGFFTRTGGTSGGLYSSLNCGMGSGDDKSHVMQNRQRVARAIDTDADRLLSLYQIHSDKVVTVTSPWAEADKPHADAMVTNRPGIALGILTADCVPVLLADREHGVIGAAHAGWRGSFAGIVRQTVAAMCTLGAARERIAAATGPCIAQASYEVDASFHNRFLKQNAQLAGYFKPSARAEHYLFDIRGYVGQLLAAEGIHSINPLENDTYMEEDAFFSFRRTTHRQEPDYGRQISAIML